MKKLYSATIRFQATYIDDFREVICGLPFMVF